MTSTTIFGGFNPDGRNSSKVLKPPGGGTSDIFGTTGNQPEENGGGTPARRVKNHNASNVFLNDGGQVATTPARSHDTAETNGENGHSETDSASTINGNSTAPVTNGNSGPAAARTRVPPGGFSSGLW